MILRRSLLAPLSLSAMLLASTAPAFGQSASLIQPGEPGAESRMLTAAEAVAIADSTFTAADVEFMQGMIVHHQQAVDMANLVEGRTENTAIRGIAGRILTSQEQEIGLMSDWLTQRGQPVAMGGMDHSTMDHSGHHGMNHSAPQGMDHSTMAGMATPAQMAQLAASEGAAFDRMFLQLMIAHHQGAITMVDTLRSAPGSTNDSFLERFAADVVNDQAFEINRMSRQLAGMTDPREGLSPGVYNAGEAILNLEHVHFQPKPAGFYPEGAELPESVPSVDGDDRPVFATGSAFSFANTDIAFSGDLMVAGSYHGFNAYRLDENGVPNLVSSVVCPGGQGDISIVGDLLLMSVEENRGRTDCGLEGVQERVSDKRLRGLRIFDISDITAPRQVGLVQTCRGSHTHSVVNVNDERILVYNSGTGGVRAQEELETCVNAGPQNEQTALFSIDVIEIPLANPAEARIVSSPRVFADDAGNIAGLWQGGNHGPNTQSTRPTDQCHDITVFPTLNLAAGACSGNGILMDISDPYNPVRIDAVTDEGFAYWHSATFNNDGSVVLFTDEWGGGGAPRCLPTDPDTWGADAFYSIEDGQLVRRGTFKIPGVQSELENCVAHNGSIIPVPGRDIFVQAWYQGGLSVIDFTDPDNPFEIAYFDRGPVSDTQVQTGGYWSVYWYNGRIYGTEIARGIDVFELTPSEFLTAEEIAAAENADMGETFNPQTQYPVTWPE
ncbi:DUF305 domain-containing protein [Erythrobacter sp. EC-HK427]|uniref:DUF305 domain-containing protein n=1 Tax=Erythrobacter sp. EC-HK427 TaxID=2038396 RepID=UPI001255FD0E|nr:DUF305 domain-containing protein [Erythrobacter sp. EC-HK427]VVT05415.1 conserved exported hypothetical protein [Erythrobacter sp. EC-HK427]